MPDERETTDAGGLSRRQLITRGAIAGGLVWAAPVIRTTAAYATTSNGTEKPCRDFFMVVFNPEGKALPPPVNNQHHTVPPAMRRWFRDNPAVIPQYPSVKPQLTAVSNEEAAVLLPEVTGPNAAGRQCRLVIGWARKGEKSFAEGFVDPDPPIAVAVGRRLIFPCPEPENQHSASVAASGAPSTSTPAEGDGTLGADGSAAATVNSDGRATPTLQSDGRPSSGGGGNGNGGCFSAIYLIYCCPR